MICYGTQSWFTSNWSVWFWNTFGIKWVRPVNVGCRLQGAAAVSDQLRLQLLHHMLHCCGDSPAAAVTQSPGGSAPAFRPSPPQTVRWELGLWLRRKYGARVCGKAETLAADQIISGLWIHSRPCLELRNCWKRFRDVCDEELTFRPTAW